MINIKKLNMSPPSSKIKVIYFDLMGRGEILRLLLHAGGKDFDDVRLQPRDMEIWKPKAPFGQVPLLEIDGKCYGQSLPLANYLAKQLGLHGKTDLEQLQVDGISMTCYDLFVLLDPVFHRKMEAEITRRTRQAVAAATYTRTLWQEEVDEIKKRVNVEVIEELIAIFKDVQDLEGEEKYVDMEAAKALQESAFPRFWASFEKILKENGSGYFVGSSLTLADLMVFDLFTGSCARFIGHPKQSDFPLLIKFVENILLHPRLSPYLKTRKP